MSEEVDKKEKKKQGPIRTGAVVPFIVFVGLVVVFNIFLLDTTIKKTIEIVGQEINGAEVNVKKVESSFSDLKIKVSGIQFTDKSNPKNNAFEIGNISFKLLWDALLRGKFVIDLAKVGDIRLNTERKRVGFVVPPKPESEKESKAEAETKKALKKVSKEFEGNVFGDIAGVLGGGSTGDVSQNVSENLESKKKFEALSAKVKTKEKELSEQFKSLPSKDDLNKLKERFNKIKWKDLGNLVKAPGILKEADKVNKDLNKSLKSYNKLNKNLNSSIKEIDKDYKEAESYISKDIASVQKRMNLPTLDQESIAKTLFGPEVLDKLEKVKKYQKIAQKYMPPKKEKAKVVSTPRKKGRDYQFGKPNAYPMFWLKLAEIDSKNDQGSVIGKIENVTNDQIVIGKLTTAQAKADFPGLEMRNIDVKMTIDHREKATADLVGEIGSMKVKDKALSKSKDTKFVIKESNVNTKFSGRFDGDKAKLKIDNDFKDLVYDVDASSNAMKEVLNDVARKTKVLTLDAKVTGKWSSLAFDIKSNLAQAIQNSVRSLISEKISAAQNKIRSQIESQISSARSSVDKQVNQLKSSFNKQLNEAKKQVKKVENDFKKKKKKAEKDVKKNLKNPFKGIKL